VIPADLEGTVTDVGQWRADPSGRHQYRWWDGAGWTERVSDRGQRGVDPLTDTAPAGVVTKEKREKAKRAGVGRRRRVRFWLNPGGVVAVLGGAAGIVGTLITMTTSTLGPVSETATYFDTDRGKFVFGISIAIVVVSVIGLLKPSPNGFLVLLVVLGGIAVTTLAVYDRIDMQNQVDELTRAGGVGAVLQVTFDAGLYVCIAGGVAAALGAVLAASRR
jgi:hypothetical protein